MLNRDVKTINITVILTIFYSPRSNRTLLCHRTIENAIEKEVEIEVGIAIVTENAIERTIVDEMTGKIFVRLYNCSSRRSFWTIFRDDLRGVTI